MEFTHTILTNHHWLNFKIEGSKIRIVLTDEEYREVTNKLIQGRRHKEIETFKFNKDFKKLDEDIFTTIRIHSKDILINEIVCIDSPNKKFNAKLIGVSKRKLHDIHISTLKDDLEVFCHPYSSVADCYSECLEGIQKYYPDLTLDSEVYLYYFKKV